MFDISNLNLLILILFVALMVLFLCFCKSETMKNNNNNKIYNLYTNVDHYRIGDLLKGYGNSPMIGNDKTLSLRNGILKKHRNTLAYEFIIQSNNNNNNQEENYKLLNKIINEKIKNEKIKNNLSDVCVVHLRVGDILDDPHYNNSKEKLMNKFNNNIPNDNEGYSPSLVPNWYIRSKEYYLKEIDELKKKNIKNVIIIAGSHINIGNYKMSSYYINLIKNLFEKNGFNVKLKLASHPDDDIILVSKCKYFISAQGSYSQLLSEIWKMNN